VNLISKLSNKIASKVARHRFESCGRDATFFPLNSEFGFENISVGRRVFIGPFAYFRATHGKIKIGNHVMFGPSVYILGGNHIFDHCGEYMIDLKKTADHSDEPVIIDDDTWIGARATILSGVTIGEGAVIAAGCVVNRDVPPYEIHGGVPNRKIGERFSSEILEKHRQKIKNKHA
jgi:acetyltransferase-like isoleucine patch superfamily enzyme